MKRLTGLLLILMAYFPVSAQVCPEADGGISKTDITCFGAADGSITASVHVDDPGSIIFYMYNLNKGQLVLNYDQPGNPTRTILNAGRTVQFENVTAGRYAVVVFSDVELCDELVIGGMTGFPISEPDPITINYMSAPDCDGSGSGSIDLAVGGGTPGYSFVWTGPTAIGNVEDPTGLLAGTYSVTITDLNNCVASLSDMVVEPGQTVFAGDDGSFCETGSYIATGAAAEFYNSIVWSSSGDGSFVDTGILNAEYTPGPGDIAAGIATLTLTGQKAGCPDVSDAVDLIITPSPIADAGSDGETCANAPFDLGAGIPSASNFSSLQWSSSGDGSFINEATLAPTYTPGTADIANGSATLTLRAYGLGNCGFVEDQMTLLITPAPIVDAGIDAAICETDFYNLSGSAPTASNYSVLEWSTSGAGAFDNNALMEPVYTPGPADILAGNVTLTLRAYGDGSCAAVEDQMTLTFAAPPTANAGDDMEVCAGTPFDLGFSGTTVTASNYNGLLWTTSGDGIFSNPNDLMPVYTPGQEDRNLGTVTLTLEAYGLATCGSVSDAMTLTITVAPEANAGSDAGVCEGDPYDLTASAPSANNYSDVQWTSSGIGTFDDATSLTPTYTPHADDIAAGSVVLTLQANGLGSCALTTDDMTLSFTPAPVVDSGADGTVCAGSSYALIASAPSASEYSGLQWSSSGTGTFDDATILTPVYTPSADDIIAGTVTLTLQALGNGSCGSTSDALTLTITPAPAANAGDDQTICADATLDFSSLPVSPSVSHYSDIQWTSSGDGGFDDAASLTPIYTPGAADIAVGSVVLTLQANGLGSCAPATDDMTLSFTPAPVVDAGADGEVCEGSSYALIASVPSASGYSGLQWLSSGTGTFDDATILTPVYTPSADDIIADTVTLTLQALGNGSCGSTSDALTLTITPAPAANAGDDQTICADATLDFSSLPVSPSASHYSDVQWTSSGIGTFDDATSLTPTYTPHVDDIAAGSVVLALQANGLGSCAPATDDMTLSFTPAPVVDAGTDGEVCAGSSYALIASAPSASEYSGLQWLTSGTGTFDDAMTLTPVYTPSAEDILAGTATLTLQVLGNGSCGSTSDALTLTITPAPAANAGDDQTICADATLDFSSLPVAPSASHYNDVQWTSSGDGGFDDAASLTPIYTPGAADIAADSVVLTVQANGLGSCAPATDDMTLSFTPAPVVDAGTDGEVCEGSSYALIASAPSASEYSGLQWLSSGTGTFDDATILTPVYTSSADDIIAGTVTLTLQALGNGSCGSTSDALTLTITPAPAANAGDDQTICADATLDFSSLPVSPSASHYSDIQWTSSGDGGFDDAASLTPIYTPGAADIAADSVVLTLQTNGLGSCAPATDDMTLSFTTAPVVDAGADGEVCAGSSYALIASAPSASEYSGLQWLSSGTGTFDDATILTPVYTPSADDIIAGTVTLTLQTAGNGSCAPAVDQLTLTINPLPQAFNLVASNNGHFCEDESGVTIGLDNSEDKVRYRLYMVGALAEVASVNGTGAPISFGNFGDPGEYYATAENLETGCAIGPGDTIAVTEHATPDQPEGATDVAYCAGEPVPEISVNAPAPGFRIDWFDQPTGGISLGTGHVFTPITAGDYYAAVIDEATGCSSPRIVVSSIEKSRPVTPVISGNGVPECITEGTYHVDDHLGSVFNWFVSDNDDFTIVVGQGSNSVNVSVGSFNGWIGVVETNGGCESDTATFEIQPDCFAAAFDAAPRIVCSGEPITFDPSRSSGVTDQTVFNWDFGPEGQANNAGSGLQTIVFTNTGSEIDTILVRLELTNPGSSAYTDTIFVRPLPGKPIIIPVDDPVCSSQGTVQLQVNLPGGVWSGEGIIDTDAGVFDPSVVDTDLNPLVEIIYTLTDGNCFNSDTTLIEVYPQPNVTFRIEDIQTQETDVMVPIVVSDFSNLLTAQFAVKWDETILQYAGINDFGPLNLKLSNFGETHVGSGVLTFSWDSLFASSLNDQDTIFAMRFNVVGEPCTTGIIAFSDTLVGAIEVSDLSLCVANVITENGFLTIQSSQGNLISAAPTDVLSPEPVCINSAVPPLTATSPGELTWYAEDQTTVLGTGISFIPAIDVAVAGETLFYVAAKEGLCPESEKVEVNITVVESIEPEAAITADQNFPICAGDPVIFTATPTNAGEDPEYQWYMDGNPISGETGQTYTMNNASAGAFGIKVQLTSSLDCANPNPVESVEIDAAFTDSVEPFVSISASDTIICEGEEITFSIDSISGEGSGPAYQWRVNDTDVPGETNPVFITNSLTHLDRVDLVVESNASCRSVDQAISNSFSIDVNSEIVATVDISISHNPVCDGEDATFVASYTNAGSNPSFQWFRKGASLIAMGIDHTIVVNDLDHHDSVFVVMTIVDPPSCLLQNPVTSDTIVVIEPGAISPSVLFEGPESICLGEEAVFTISDSTGGGTDPSFAWFLNGQPTGVSDVAYTAPVSLASGIHNISVQMTKGGLGTGCINPDSDTHTVQLTVKPADDPSCEIIEMTAYVPRVERTSCPTINDGRIYLRVDDGSSSFRYKVGDGPWVDLAKRNIWIGGVSYGDHFVYVEDIATGFIDSVQVFVGSVFGLAEQPVVINPTCAGGDGAFSMKLTGGSGAFHVRVTDEDGIIYEQLNVVANVLFENLNAGVYTVVISDVEAGGCNAQETVTLNTPVNCDNPCQFTVQAEAFAETCHPELTPNGSVVFHTDPAGGYEYILILGQDTIGRHTHAAFNNLYAGEYKFTVINQNPGCANTYETGSVTVPLQKTTLNVEATVIGGASCFNEATGQAQLTVSGGGVAPYHYSIDHGATWRPFNSGDMINDLPPREGPYNILVVDDPATDQCPAEVEVHITNVFPLITANVTSEDASCNANDGSITINNIAGGLPGYTVEFEGKTYDYSSDIPLTFTGLPGGDKTFTIVDATHGGCRKDFNVFISAPGMVQLNLPLQIAEATCSGNGEDAEVSFSVDLGQSPLSGQYWYGVALPGEDIESIPLTSFSPMQTRTVKNLSYGSYKLVVTASQDGCRNSYDFEIESGPAKVDFDVIALEDKICEATSGYLEIGNFRGRMDLEFFIRISDVDNNVVFSGSYSRHQPKFKLDTLNSKLAPRDYKLMVYQQQDNCEMSADTFFTIYSVASPEVAIKEATPSWEDVDQGSLLVRINSPKNNEYSASIDMVNWIPVQPQIGPEGGYETKFDKLPYGDYRVWIRDDSQGDKCIVRVDTAVARNTQLWIPNIFTPNEDGYNDAFYIRNLPDGSELTIKNRWGRIVYSNKDYRNDWTGRDLPEGMYYYYLSGKDLSSSGWIELFRGAGPDLK